MQRYGSRGATGSYSEAAHQIVYKMSKQESSLGGPKAYRINNNQATKESSVSNGQSSHQMQMQMLK